MNENKRFHLNGSCVFDYEYKKNRPKKFGLTMEQNLLESLRKSARLKEYTFTLQ